MHGASMAESPVPPLPAECPQCHAPLESGVLLAPRGIYWADKSHWSILFSEPVLSMWASLKMPNVPTSRCRSCGLCLFRWHSSRDYEEGPRGIRYACPGCGGDVYAGEPACPACGTRLPETG